MSKKKEDMPSDTTAVAPLTPAPQRKAALARLADAVTTNLDLCSTEGMRFLMLSELTKSVGIWEEDVKIVQTAAIIQRQFESTNRNTGLVETKTHTRFVTPDGLVYWTNSDIVARVIGALVLGTAGTGLYDPPLNLSFNEEKIGNGQSVLTVSMPVDEVSQLFRRK